MDELIYEKIGKRLKIARESRRITLEQAGERAGVHKSTVLRWENGETKKINLTIIETLANYYLVNPSWLAGHDVPMYKDSNVIPMSDKIIKVPILGKISAGLPLYAEENLLGYDYIPASTINPNDEYFCLLVKGDSMNLKFNEGDRVLIHKQESLENGEIGVILVNGDDATIKKYRFDNGMVILEPMSTNPDNHAQIYNPKETTIKIVGKAIRFISDL